MDRTKPGDQRLVGRTRELDLIRQAITTTSEGTDGCAIFLRGVPGVGKSRLLREAALEANNEDFLIVQARCSQDRSALQPLQEAMFDITRDRNVLEDPRLESFLPSLRWLTSPAGAPHEEHSMLVLGEALLRAMAIAGKDAPVLLSVEDLHWADPETISVIEYLVDHAPRQKLILIATTRPEPSPGSEMVQRASARRAGRLLELRPLSISEMEELASAILAGALPEEIKDALYERTEGIPFLVEEVLAAAITDEVVCPTSRGWDYRGGLAEIVPATVTGLVLARAEGLSPDVRQVMNGAAILGRVFSETPLVDMTGLEAHHIAQLLGIARDAMFVEPTADRRMRFRHALIRDALLSGMLQPERKELASRGLSALSALPDEDPVMVARLAEEAGNVQLAAQLLCRAGRDQLGKGGLRSAEETVRRGIAMVADDPKARVDLDEALLEILSTAGKTEEARVVGDALLVLLRGLAAPSLREAVVHLRLARNAVNAGAPDEAEAHARTAARLAPSGILAARADIELAEAAWAKGDTNTAGKLAGVAVGVAEGAADTEVLCAALDVAGRSLRSTDWEQGKLFFERLLSTASVENLPLWRARALMHLGALDMLTGGRLDRLQEASASAERIGAMGTAAEIEVQTVLILATQFRLDEALEVSNRAAARAERYRLAVLPMTVVCQGGMSGWMANRPAMERYVAKAVDIAGEDPTIAALCWGDLRGMCSIFEDDRKRGLSEIEKAMTYPPGYLTSPAPFRGMWALLRTLEDVEGDYAREVVRETAAHESWWILAWLRYAEAVALGRRGRRSDAEEASNVADEMIDGHVLGGWAKHLARRHIAEAALSARWGDPLTWLNEAGSFFEATHPRIASSCRALLRREGVALPRRGRGSADVPPPLQEMGVTSREMDVLLLIVQGASNRGIASRLFLSHRTIEKHVQSLLQKTDVDSRTKLAILASKLTGNDLPAT